MTTDNGNGQHTRDLLRQFEEHHEQLCAKNTALFDAKLKPLEERVERVERKAETATEVVNKIRGALVLAVFAIPLLVTIGVFIANHYSK